MGSRFSDLDERTREALLDLMWGAWFASRPENLQQTLFRSGAGDQYAQLSAAAGTSGDILKLMLLGERLRASGGHEDALQAISGLQDGLLVMHVPPRLERVIAATDDERAQLTVLVRQGIADRLSDESLADLAAVLVFLLEVQPSPDGETLVRTKAPPAFLGAVLSDVGLPVDRHESLVAAWVA